MFTLVYNKEQIPNNETKSIFLAGPTSRSLNMTEWRTQALEILKKLGYDGTVYIPQERSGNFDPSTLEKQIDWEYKCMCACDAIIFWIPREMREDFEMIGLTTNVEFGRFLNSNKLFCGSPKDAKKMDYLKIISKNKFNWHESLEELIKSTVDYLGDGVYREGIECLIPMHIFKSKQFQDWYQSHKKNGNKLTDFHSEYEFVMPKMKKLFLTIFKPDVWIKGENRIKDNEFVVARSNMSYICAYHKNTNGQAEVLLCDEFRTPAVNEESRIYELIGGSSFNPSDDELEVACHEFEEETGVAISKDRFKKIDIKQSAGTLCSHQIALFAIELTDEEIDHFRNDHNVHGVEEDTERVHLHVMSLNNALKKVDWTNSGMILSAIYM